MRVRFPPSAPALLLEFGELPRTISDASSRLKNVSAKAMLRHAVFSLRLLGTASFFEPEWNEKEELLLATT